MDCGIVVRQDLLRVEMVVRHLTVVVTVLERAVRVTTRMRMLVVGHASAPR
jgi:hypothetical protein